MAKFVIYEEPIYEYYRDIIEFDVDSRKNITDEKLNATLNLNIILSVHRFFSISLLTARAKHDKIILN